ncbi:MAG TPA: response regulator FixJ [Allosphingosinicella sp.]|jgi:two-component system response regulator FixJ
MNEGTVHVVDDDEAMRHSLAFLLETAGHEVRTYASAIEFLEAVPGMERGCIVTDVRMPGLSGLELVERLHEMGVTDPVIVITGHGDVPLAVHAMKAGVSDFIEKPFAEEALLSSIRAALAKGSGTRAEEEGRRLILERIEALSERERQVLDGLVEGKPNKIIAFDLGISARTVEIYRANLMTKMQAGSLSELVRMVLLAGRSA